MIYLFGMKKMFSKPALTFLETLIAALLLTMPMIVLITSYQYNRGIVTLENMRLTACQITDEVLKRIVTGNINIPLGTNNYSNAGINSTFGISTTLVNGFKAPNIQVKKTRETAGIYHHDIIEVNFSWDSLSSNRRENITLITLAYN